MTKYWYIKVLCIILIFIKHGCYAQDISLSSTQELPLNVTNSIGIFRDSSAKLTLEQVVTKNFSKPHKEDFIFPYSNDVFWVRLTLKNNNFPNKKWFLVWSNPLVEQLDFYISDSTSQKFLHTQQKLFTADRERPFIDQDPKFAFELSPKQSKTVYLKLTSRRGHYGVILLHSTESYYEARLEEYSKQGFFNGLVIFRLFLVLILSAFVIKDLAFRVYSFHTVLKTFAYWGFLNIAGPLFTDNPDLAKRINFFFYSSVTLGGALFILITVVDRKLPKWHSFILYFIIAFTLFLSFIVFIDYQWYWLKAGAYNIVFAAVYYISLYTYCIIRKIPIEKYYAIPFILGLTSYALLYIRLLGWIEYEPLYRISYLLFVGEIFVFIIFLGRIFRNVEHNKAVAEHQLNFNLEQNARLKELDNLKTNFFTNISHEFRTPLTLLVGPLADLAKRFPNDWSVAAMQRNTARLQKLINQFLDLSKLDAGKLDITIRQKDMVQFMKQTLASFESLAQSKQIIFTYNQNLNEKEAYFDADKVEIIFTNLLSNAFKFTPLNGRILVDIIYSHDEVQIIIKDSGIGISAEKLPFVFNRFYQVTNEDSSHKNYEGTGIGLALVKEMVELHQGKVLVESTEGRGTTFFVKLPIDKHTWQNRIMPAVESPEPTLADLSYLISAPVSFNDEHTLLTDEENILLIVEDNEDLRKYIRSVFENDYQIIEAIDGQEGLEKALAFIPDIIVTDLMMPRLDGLEFCKLLKTDEKTSHIPVIMLTAKASIANRIEGFEFGVDDYLSKPFNKEELQVRVRNLLNQRALLRQKYDKQVIDLKPTEIIIASIDEKFIGKAKDIIEKNLSDNEFDIEYFASEMAMTPVVLRRKIKAITNQTATQFVRKYRLQKAANLLANHADTVSNIAYQVGFENLSYFTRAFQEEFGQLPSDYGK